jgi:uncharacterized OsmC-like protein
MSTSVHTEQPTQETLRNVITSTAEALKDNPGASDATFSVTSELTEGFLSRGKARNFDIVIDEPEGLGGTNLGANPVEYVLAALGACQEIVVKAYASVLGIEVKKVEVEARGDLDLKGFFNVDSSVRPGFTGVEFVTTIHTEEQDEEKLAQLKHLSDDRCPVLDIIKNKVPVNGKIVYEHLAETVAAE